jgi:hypothetical protein
MWGFKRSSSQNIPLLFVQTLIFCYTLTPALINASIKESLVEEKE